jgi:hypothetical protein
VRDKPLHLIIQAVRNNTSYLIIHPHPTMADLKKRNLLFKTKNTNKQAATTGKKVNGTT